MRARSRVWILVLLLAFLAGCGDDPVSPPRDEARITVYAHTGETPVSGIRAEVVQPGLSGTTGADGKVHFTVASGEYTVRVHNTYQQYPPYFDHHVNVRIGDQALIDADHNWKSR